jgi:hypothetical protein
MTTATQWGKDTTQTATQRNTEQQQAALWSKIGTLMKNGLLLKNAAQIFRATAENWVSSTRRATHTAHSKHSKRFYALFLRFSNSNSRAAQQTACRAFHSVVFALSVWLFDYGNAAYSDKYV